MTALRESGCVARMVFTVPLGAATTTNLSPLAVVTIWDGELSFSAERRTLDTGAVLPVRARMLAEDLSNVAQLP